MAEKKEQEKTNGQQLNPDQRFKYIGFEVQPGKIGEFFKSDTEKDKWVDRVREKRKGGARLREKNSFDEPRVAGYEKFVLAITSILLVVSLFLPWFSGYSEYEVKAETAEAQPMAVVPPDSSMIDSTTIGLTPDQIKTDAAVVETDKMVDTNLTAAPADSGEIVGAAMEKDEHGFSAITGARKRKEIKKEYHSASAIGSLSKIGDVFSSGFILKITGFLYLIYMLFCIASALMTLYLIFGAKGDPDTAALKLKRALRLNWIPVGIWFFCMIIAVFGASYSFNVGEGGLKQLGDSYGIGVYLGLLGYGFYISLACFVMNAVKAIEI
jgi:hypothetical protein